VLCRLLDANRTIGLTFNALSKMGRDCAAHPLTDDPRENLIMADLRSIPVPVLDQRMARGWVTTADGDIHLLFDEAGS
jgi:hypothetical protein